MPGPRRKPVWSRGSGSSSALQSVCFSRHLKSINLIAIIIIRFKLIAITLGEGADRVAADADPEQDTNVDSNP